MFLKNITQIAKARMSIRLEKMKIFFNILINDCVPVSSC